MLLLFLPPTDHANVQHNIQSVVANCCCGEQIVNFVGVQGEVQEEAQDREFRERLRKIPLPDELMRDDNDDAGDEMCPGQFNFLRSSVGPTTENAFMPLASWPC